MAKSDEKKTVEPGAVDLLDKVRESDKGGFHGAREALPKVRCAVDQAVPVNLQPLSKAIIDAAIELADQLVTTQSEFHRSIVRSADRGAEQIRRRKELSDVTDVFTR